MPDPTIRLILELTPHVRTYRSRAVHSPDLSRLRTAEWWNRAIWGEPGGRDPVPVVVSVEELGPAVSADPPPVDKITAAVRALTGPQAAVLLALHDGPTTRIVVTKGGGYVRQASGGAALDRPHKKVVEALWEKGMLAGQENGVGLSELGERVAAAMEAGE